MKELGIKNIIENAAFTIWHLAQRSLWPLLGGDIEGLFPSDLQDNDPSRDFNPNAVDSNADPYPEVEIR